MKTIIKKLNIYYVCLASMIGAMLVIFMIFGVFKKEKVFSDIERRNLKTFSDVNVDIFDNDFAENIENVLVDQFVFRDSFIKIKSAVDVLLHKNYSNGVYVLNDRYIEEEANIDYDIIASKSIDMTKEMENVRADVYFMLFPNACNVDKDKIGWIDKYDYQNDIFDLFKQVYLHTNIQYVDMREAVIDIKKQNKDVYYKTDHHITSDAMHMLKDKILEYLSIKDDREYERVELCDNFQGSLMSKSCVFRNIYDKICAYIDKNPVRYEMYDYGEQKDKISIYDFDKINSYDPYLVFMGNNSKLISIKTENYDKKRLLLIKDSYANCFIPYLLPYYSIIDVVDPRYTTDIKELVSYENYDDIIYFYNMNTFMSR